MTIEEFKKNFMSLELNFNEVQTKERCRFFWERLKGYSADHFERALKLLMENETRFPVLATFMKYLKGTEWKDLYSEEALWKEFLSILGGFVRSPDSPKERFLSVIAKEAENGGFRIPITILERAWEKTEQYRKEGRDGYDCPS